VQSASFNRLQPGGQHPSFVSVPLQLVIVTVAQRAVQTLAAPISE
jgi:hypothetical protein